MAILIENMDMPKSCLDCPLNNGEYAVENYEKRYCAITYHEMRKSDYKKKPKDCPLKSEH